MFSGWGPTQALLVHLVRGPSAKYKNAKKGPKFRTIWTIRTKKFTLSFFNFRADFSLKFQKMDQKMDHITNFSPKKDQNFRPFGPFGPENFTFFILNFGSIRCFGPDQKDQKYQTIMYMAHSFRTKSS